MCNVAVLIPTRNRPEKVAKLLASLASSSLIPKQIVIVASGYDIREVVASFDSILLITYVHTDVTGQIAQKKMGIGLISKTIDWCLFLDDDLLIETSSIEVAMSAASTYPNGKVAGIGFSLPPTSRSINASFFAKKIARFFKIGYEPAGKVFKSGHASSYLQESTVAETSWLNGASMWRREYIDSYGDGLPSTKYAACEDLIFSYPLSKVDKLIYVPMAKLNFQDVELSDFNSLQVIEAAAFWRYYFVSINVELSTWEFAFSQFGRILFATINTKTNRFKLFVQLINIEYRIISAVLKKTDPKVLLSQLEK